MNMVNYSGYLVNESYLKKLITDTIHITLFYFIFYCEDLETTGNDAYSPTPLSLPGVDYGSDHPPTTKPFSLPFLANSIRKHVYTKNSKLITMNIMIVIFN